MAGDRIGREFPAVMMAGTFVDSEEDSRYESLSLAKPFKDEPLNGCAYPVGIIG